MNKILKYAVMALAIALVFTAVDASAQAQGAFGIAMTKLLTTFKNSRAIIFIVGGFGLIGLGFAAIFGKVQWKWLAALAIGLAIVAIAGKVVDYVTRDSAGGAIGDVQGSNFADTMN